MALGVEREGCSRWLEALKEGGAEDAAIREGGRERGMLTHEESRGGGGGALERCRQVRGGCDRPCFWGRGMDMSGDRAGLMY